MNLKELKKEMPFNWKVRRCNNENKISIIVPYIVSITNINTQQNLSEVGTQNF